MPFSDGDVGGNSSIEIVENSEAQINYSYFLGDQYQFPFVGITFKDIYNGIRDFSMFSYFDVKVKTSQSRTLKVSFEIALDQVPGMEIPFSYVEQEIPVWKDQEYYRIYLNDLIVPDWWYDEFNLSRYDIPDIDLSKVIGISINAGDVLPVNVIDQVELDGFTFRRSIYIPLFTGAAFLVLWGAALLAVLFVLPKIRSRSTQEKVAPYLVVTPPVLELRSTQDVEFQRLIDFINTNYQYPDLSVEKAAKGCSVPHYRVSKLLKENCQTGFSQYLTHTRLTEAKRLLISTNLQIIDIALGVGYNSAAHFNRIFKREEGVTPGEFRRNARVSL